MREAREGEANRRRPFAMYLVAHRRRIHRAPRRPVSRPVSRLAPRPSSFLPRPSQRGCGCILGRGHRPERRRTRRSRRDRCRATRAPRRTRRRPGAAACKFSPCPWASPRRRRRGSNRSRPPWSPCDLSDDSATPPSFERTRRVRQPCPRTSRSPSPPPPPPIVRAPLASGARAAGDSDERANRRRQAGHEVTVRVGKGLFVIRNVAVMPFICFSAAAHRSATIRATAASSAGPSASPRRRRRGDTPSPRQKPRRQARIEPSTRRAG